MYVIPITNRLPIFFIIKKKNNEKNNFSKSCSLKI